MWSVTIDQLAASGGQQRYTHDSASESIGGAISEAIEEHGLEDVVVGQYQVTVKRAEGTRPVFSGTLVADTEA
jgi:hypothetical protein